MHHALVHIWLYVTLQTHDQLLKLLQLLLQLLKGLATIAAEAAAVSVAAAKQQAGGQQRVRRELEGCQHLVCYLQGTMQGQGMKA